MRDMHGQSEGRRVPALRAPLLLHGVWAEHGMSGQSLPHLPQGAQGLPAHLHLIFDLPDDPPSAAAVRFGERRWMGGDIVVQAGAGGAGGV